MIEKKRSNEVPHADMDEDEDLHLHHDDALEEDEDPVYPEYEEDAGGELNIDPEADAVARKRKANMIFYGGVVIGLIVIGFLAYPQIKRTFFKEQPKQTATAGVPVPMKARESKFTLAGTASQPEAPVGTVATPGDTTNVAPPPAGITSLASPASTTAATTTTATAATDTGAAVTTTSVAPPSGQAATAATTSSTAPAAAYLPAAGTGTPPVATTQNEGMQAHLADLDNKVANLQSSFASLSASQQASTASLGQIQAGLDTL